MKKTIENLLFDLLEKGEISLTRFQNVEEACLTILSQVDPLVARIEQAIDAPNNVKISITHRTKHATVTETIILPSKKIENFLSFAHHVMEREEEKSSNIISEYGQAKFNELREDVLNILAEKPSKNFILIEDYKLDGMGNFMYTIEDKDTGANSIITIAQKQVFNNILPLKIHLQTLIKSGESLKSAGMAFSIPENELSKYPLIFNEKPKIKTEEEFLNALIVTNNDHKGRIISSKVLEHFNLSVMLPEKETDEKRFKL